MCLNGDTLHLRISGRVNDVTKKVVTARLDEALYDKLRELAEVEERSMAYIIEKAVEGYVVNNAPPQLKFHLEGHK